MLLIPPYRGLPNIIELNETAVPKSSIWDKINYSGIDRYVDQFGIEWRHVQIDADAKGVKGCIGRIPFITEGTTHCQFAAVGYLKGKEIIGLVVLTPPVNSQAKRSILSLTDKKLFGSYEDQAWRQNNAFADFLEQKKKAAAAALSEKVKAEADKLGRQ